MTSNRETYPAPISIEGPTLQTLEFDEDILGLVPELSTEVYSLLEHRILKNRLTPCVYTLDGKLVDGRASYDICQRHAVPYCFIKLDRLSRVEVMKRVLLNHYVAQPATALQRTVMAQKFRGISGEDIRRHVPKVTTTILSLGRCVMR